MFTDIEPTTPTPNTNPEQTVPGATPRRPRSKLKILERVEAAEDLATRGLAVFSVYGVRREGEAPFPCACPRAGECSSPGKHPKTSEGVYAATSDTATLRTQTRDPLANIGIATGEKSGVWVLDVDPRHGGDETLARLEATHGGLPATWSVQTGGGGRHYFFKLTETAVPCSTSKVGPGLDVKGDGGYVVGAPSVHASGKKYAWNDGLSPDDVEPAVAPQWLLDLATGAAAVVATDDNLEPDTAPDVAQEREVVPLPATAATEVPAEAPRRDPDHEDVIAEGTRNATVFSIVCGLVRRGVSKTDVLAETRALNATRCSPPLPDAEVQQIVESAWRYAPTAPAGGTGASTSDLILPVFSAEQLMRRTFPEPRWAIEPLIPEGLGVLAGRPKVGKSWLALQAATAVATGRCTLGNFAVERGQSLYCGLEDGLRRFQSRMRKQLQGSAPPASMFLVEQGQLNTLERSGLQQIEWFLDGHPDCRLLVIDTLGRFRGGRRALNNDRYQDDVVVGDKLQRVVHDHKISLLLVHHVRKAEAEDWVDTISGSTGIAGSADYLLVLKRAREGADATLHVTGRDIVEESFALDFDQNTCLWKVSGNAVEVAMSRQRAALLEFLKSHRTPETPTNVAAALGLHVNNVKNLLWKMKDAGQVQSEGGKYFVGPASAPVETAYATSEPPTPVAEGTAVVASFPVEDDLEIPDDELRRGRKKKA